MVVSEKSSSKVQAWFCTNGLPSDIVIEVDEMTFHLHKFPLMSKSRKLHDLITEQESNPTQNPFSSSRIHTYEGQDNEDGDEIIELLSHIVVTDFPGGSETFELAAKFCYGVKVDLNSSNVAPLRCAGEFLEMTEEYSKDNLISKTESFFSQSVLKSLKDSIRALKSCERLMPLAESLGITQRFIVSIASRASSAAPTLFGWPVNDGANVSREPSNQLNGNETGGRRKCLARANNAKSLLEDLALLGLAFFKRLIFEMKARELSSEMIENCMMYYANKYIPGISRTNRKLPSSSSVASESEQRELMETIIANLPLEKSSSGTSTATRFLFGMLRTANILNASETCKAALEKKIGSQLEQATLDDLLIPSYTYLNETLYDVDCVERILGYFLDELEKINATEGEIEDVGDGVRSPALMLVGKLIDGYLSEIASDGNLKPDRFCNLAISLPEQARLFDDGLYRAVDVYLKAHPCTSETEREKISGVLDCQKLTLEACTHAKQNERLPLRAVVQVLFFEQLQLRHAIAGTLIAAETAPYEAGRGSLLRMERKGGDEEEEENETGVSALPEQDSNDDGISGRWGDAVRKNQVLRFDIDSMRTRVHQLERECSTMKKVIERIDKSGTGSSGWRRSLTRRFGCKFRTQVCDSHESTVVDARKGRRHNHQL